MSILKPLFSCLGRWAHIFVNHAVVCRLKDARHMFYSGWVCREFASCGKDATFWGFSRLSGARYIHLGRGVMVGRRVVWEVFDSYQGARFTPSMSMGDGSSFGDEGHISCVNRVQIGNGVRIGRKVFITDNSHGASDRSLLDTPPNLRPLVSKGPVIIEDNAWIGEMTCIMPGVTIGRGAIVGAGSVVTHDVPPYCLAAGNPAKVIRTMV